MKALLNAMKVGWIVFLLSATNPILAFETERSKFRPPPIAKLPISVINNRIQVTLNAEGTPLTMLLDTGATSSIFFPSAIEKGVTPDISGEAKISFPAIGKSVVGLRIKALKLSSNDFTFISQRGLLISGDAAIAAELEAEYDAILGQEFFRAFTVEIDPENKFIRLYEPGTNLKNFYDTSHRLYMEGHTPHIRFFSQLPWEPRPTSKAMLLDTGYPGSMVLWNKRHYRQAASNGQIVEKREDSSGIVSHIKLKFGDLEFENIAVFIARSVPYQSLKRDGLIGASILAQHRHVIDFAQARLFMSPVYGSSGQPLQIIDGLIYTPNNENFDLKTYYPKIPIHPTLVIYATGKQEVK